MRAIITACLAVAAGAALFGAPGFAHHGAAAYTEEIVTLQGTITEFRYVNPHVQLYFDVQNGSGPVEHWQGEMTSPNKLARAGWSKSTLQAGDRLAISGRAGRNGGKSVWITGLVRDNGENLPTRESVD